MSNDTKRFLILGQSRSGTQLLRSLLNSHPDVHCDGELLRRDLRYTRHRWLHELLRVYPDPLLRSWQNKTSTPVYGCNLMIYHMLLPKPTLRRLVRSDWRIIHLMREDLLDIALSYLIANRSDVWHREAGSPSSNNTFRIPPMELERELIKRSRWRQLEIELTREIPCRKVIYERDLVDSLRWQSTCDALFDEFRIDSSPVSTGLQRTDPRCPEEIIENFAGLKAWLENSRFRHLSGRAGRA